MSLDVKQLVIDMKLAASTILQTDVSTFRGFSERQLDAIAQQTAFVAQGILSGEITAETRDFFLDSLEDMALNFAKTLRGLVLVTVEKVWNAVVAVLWKAIAMVTDLVLPSPTHSA